MPKVRRGRRQAQNSRGQAPSPLLPGQGLRARHARAANPRRDEKARARRCPRRPTVSTSPGRSLHPACSQKTRSPQMPPPRPAQRGGAGGTVARATAPERPQAECPPWRSPRLSADTVPSTGAQTSVLCLALTARSGPAPGQTPGHPATLT